jgi:hypothetical protein
VDGAFAFAATISQQRLPAGDVALDEAIAFAAQRPCLPAGPCLSSGRTLPVRNV